MKCQMTVALEMVISQYGSTKPLQNDGNTHSIALLTMPYCLATQHSFQKQ
jgi:hypothetical protein